MGALTERKPTLQRTLTIAASAARHARTASANALPKSPYSAKKIGNARNLVRIRTALHVETSARVGRRVRTGNANALMGPMSARESASPRRTSRRILTTVDHAERHATKRLERYARTEVVSVLKEINPTLRRTTKTVENARPSAKLRREKHARTESANALMVKRATDPASSQNQRASGTAQPSDLKEKVVSFVIPFLAYPKIQKHVTTAKLSFFFF